MHIEINSKTIIKDIQKTFSDFYPFLKLEFYGKPHDKYELSDANDIIPSEMSLGELNAVNLPAVIHVRPLEKVREFEAELLQQYGLSVQILKKEGDGWEQTTGMDDFTFKEVNEFGRSSSDEYIMSDEEDDLEETT